jgi:uncharacterized phage-like protein YoqJ
MIHYMYDERNPDCLRLKMLLASEIEMMTKRGVTTFLTGMVQGPDMWCAELVLDLKSKNASKDILLIAILPYEEQAAHWNTESRERYFNILAASDDVITLQTRYSSDCLYKHKRRLVDSATHLIAVHDGSRGISRYMIDYALQKGLQVLTIDPETRAKQHIS